MPCHNHLQTAILYYRLITRTTYAVASNTYACQRTSMHTVANRIPTASCGIGWCMLHHATSFVTRRVCFQSINGIDHVCQGM
jgi:hypothetical protein